MKRLQTHTLFVATFCASEQTIQLKDTQSIYAHAAVAHSVTCDSPRFAATTFCNVRSTAQCADTLAATYMYAVLWVQNYAGVSVLSLDCTSTRRRDSASLYMQDTDLAFVLHILLGLLLPFLLCRTDP